MTSKNDASILATPDPDGIAIAVFPRNKRIYYSLFGINAPSSYEYENLKSVITSNPDSVAALSGLRDGFNVQSGNRVSITDVGMTGILRTTTQIASVTSLKFSNAGDENEEADVRIMASNGSGAFSSRTLGLTVVPQTFDERYSGETQFTSDVWILQPALSSDPESKLLLWTIAHELLHAVGLRGDFGKFSNPEYYTEYNRRNLTLLAYGDQDDGSENYSTDLQLYDIWALQRHYGINTETAIEGNTYTLDAENLSRLVAPDGIRDVFTSVWDAGGVDTFDFSNAQTSAIIDLRQGEFSSSVQGDEFFFLGGLGDTFDNPGNNISIAWGTVIENATGSDKSDLIIGNLSSNVLKGGKGSDALFGNSSAYRGFGWGAHVYSLGDVVLDATIAAKMYGDEDEAWDYTGLNGTRPGTSEATDYLDGGEGNDTLVVTSGKNATTIGGKGRDYIYNKTLGGVVYGDTVDGVGAPDSSENADKIVVSRGVKLMDAGTYDQLVSTSGWRLTGGNATGQRINGNAVYNDKLLGGISYVQQGKDLWVFNRLDSQLRQAEGGEWNSSEAFVVKNFSIADNRSGWGFAQFFISQNSKLGLSFKEASPLDNALRLTFGLLGTNLLTAGPYYALVGLSLIDAGLSIANSILLNAKSLLWAIGVDPLVIDLDGDGIETVAADDGEVYFDVDGDRFAERTGWLKGDDGFLVLDSNANGRIDDIAEMFGNRFEGGYAELAAYDTNADGKISVGDLIWSELKIWQDQDQDGQTDNGELKSLDQIGILEISLANSALNSTTPQGTQLLSFGSVSFVNGRTSSMFEAIFESSDTDTRYAGEAGRAPWQLSGGQGASTLNAKGFGTITDLAVAAANDVGFAELAQSRAAAMTSPNLRTLVAQSGDVLGTWGMTLETSRELIAVRLSATGELLEHRLWDGGALEAGWSLEQAWSPTTRGSLTGMRDEAPYLTQIVGGRAVILDYGIKQADGTWKLASDPATTYATREDIAALPHPAGTEWRVEDIQANPLADLTVDEIGVYFINGEVKDYTVRVTDNDGSFYVWARNLDRALQLQAKTGAAFEFNLRNYQVNLATLDEVNSTDDSTYRVELLTPAQFHFATSLGGVDFRPEMLSASYNNLTGQLAYTVNGVRGAGRYVPQVDANGNPVLVTYSDGTVEQALEYQSDVKTMIALLQPVMEQRRRAAAANDNGAWRGAAFCFDGERNAA